VFLLSFLALERVRTRRYNARRAHERTSLQCASTCMYTRLSTLPVTRHTNNTDTQLHYCYRPHEFSHGVSRHTRAMQLSLALFAIVASIRITLRRHSSSSSLSCPPRLQPLLQPQRRYPRSCSSFSSSPRPPHLLRPSCSSSAAPPRPHRLLSSSSAATNGSLEARCGRFRWRSERHITQAAQAASSRAQPHCSEQHGSTKPPSTLSSQRTAPSSPSSAPHRSPPPRR
jgi:hypothetical protein